VLQPLEHRASSYAIIQEHACWWAQGKKKRVSTSESSEEFRQVNIDTKSPVGAAAAAAAAAATAGGVAAQILAGQQRLEQLLSACLEADRSYSTAVPAEVAATVAADSSTSMLSAGSAATSPVGSAATSPQSAAARPDSGSKPAAADAVAAPEGNDEDEGAGVHPYPMARDLSSVSDLVFMRLVGEQLSGTSADSSMHELVDSVDLLNGALHRLAERLPPDQRERISKAAKRVIAKGSWTRSSSVSCSVEVLVAKLAVAHFS
jgi:hypothetical protein